MKEAIKKIFRKIGPGFITGAADDDPSGIGTYSAAGSRFGLGQLWTPLFTFPLMAAVQEICARIGLVTGRGLAGVIRKNYSRKLLFFCVTLLVIANTINIGADIGAMASAVGLLTSRASFAFTAGALTFLILALEIFVPYRVYARFLRIFAFSLFAYWLTALFIKINWTEVATRTFWPQWQWNFDYILILVGVFGTTISPYLFFWQASEEVEEEIIEGRWSIKSRQGATLPEIKDMREDVFIGMLFSNITMFFVILVAGSTLFANGVFNIETAEQAASALKPLAGDWAYLLFTLGIIGVGLLAIPVLAGSAAYAVSEALKLREGLGLKWNQAKGFYAIILLATVVGLGMNFLGINPMQALLYTAVLNAIISVPLLFVIMKVGNDGKIMGEFKNGPLANFLGWAATIVMTLGAVVLFISFIVK
ncbi:MAG: divalent metal cation transporter [Patescibacteria group bacterium]|jgi:NRAMP (natural resistance-associated macrophage protein)-like metal ion transporter